MVTTQPLSALEVLIDTQKVHAWPKRFKSGSVGWHHSSKLEIDGTRCQVSLSIVVVGSKPKEEVVTLIDDQDKEVAVGPPQRPAKARKPKKVTQTPT